MADEEARRLLQQLNEFEATQGQAPQSGPRQKLAELDEFEGRQQGGREVIATTDDGGRVVRMSNGNLAFASPGYSTTDPAAIERIMEGATPAQEVQRSLDEQRIAENPVAARVQEFNQGAPFVGEWLDEAVGVVSPQAAENMRATSDAMERQRPGQSLGLNVAGGISYGAPMAVEGVRWAGQAGTRLGTALRGAGAGMAAGASEGATAEAGRANEGSRGDAAVRGGAIGGGLGFALGAFAPMVADGVKNLAQRVKKLDVRTIAEEFGISPGAARMAREALQNDDLDAAARRLGELGEDAMLADSGPATGALLDAAAQAGGRGLRETRDAVSQRSEAIGQRLPRSLDRILGRPRGVNSAARSISQRTAPARRKAYERAFSTPIKYADDSGRAVEDALGRIPPRILNDAIGEANDAMREAGQRNLQIMAEIGDDGDVVFREMPNVRQLDEIKKALDSIGRDADQFGRPTERAMRAQRLSRRLRDSLTDAVPAYKQALRLGGDKIQQDQALDLGRRILFDNVSVEDVSAFVGDGLPAPAMEAARQGVRETVENSMSRVRRTITDDDVAAREAMQVVKELSSRKNKDKLRLILGENRANQLLDELDRTATALALRGAVSRNSATAIRQSIQDQAAAEVEPSLARRTAGNLGNPLEAAQEVTQSLTGIDARSLNEAQRELLADVAGALTRIRGAEAQRALVAVRGAMEGQPIKDAEAELIGRLVAGTGAATVYQAGRQSLAR